MSSDANAPCPCHSGKKYKRCCRPWHQGDPAPSPEALMRSRYAAYALGLVDYVIATTAPGGPGSRADRAVWAKELEEFSRTTSFDGLEIEGTGAEGDAGWVQFRAILSTRGAPGSPGQDASFGERSGFVRREGRWLYASGSRVRAR